MISILELPDGGFVLFKAIKKEDFVQKLSIPKTKELLDYKKDRLAVYKGEGNSILVQDEDSYYEYDNIDDLKRALKYQNVSGLEVMFKKNPFKEDFPQFAEKIATDLLNLLGLGNQKITYDVLKAAEDKISQLENPYHFYRKNFLSVVALVGIAIQNKTGGRWEMELSSDGETWNMLLKSGSDEYPFFVDLYEDIFINNEIKSVLSSTYSSNI